MNDCKKDETELSAEFAAALSITNEGSGNLEQAGDVKRQSTTVDSIYTLQNVPGRGKGLVAAEKIAKGTRILSEEAIITVNRLVSIEQFRVSIFQQVQALDENQRRAFLSMHNVYSYSNAAEKFLGIFQTNSLPAEVVGAIEATKDKRAIFLEACRINHACDNNAQNSWNEKIKRHTVHAMRDIDKGEEITINYLLPLKNRKARQKALQESFDFMCSCRLCSLPLEQSQESDKRLEEIDRLGSVINQPSTDGFLVFPLRTLRYLDQQVRLYKEQKLEDIGFAQSFVYAAQLVIVNSDLARGRIFAEKAAYVWKSIFGDDSTQAIEQRALARDPSNYMLSGLSAKWKTKVDDVPQGLEPSNFEDWLWRREKPIVLGQLANLRSRTIFPGFVDLSDDRSVDPDFDDMVTYRPRRHWCFLGEIVNSTTLHHLELELKDIDGGNVSLLFYTNSRGRELAPAQIQRGYTVAILYAKRHVFNFGAPSIRHEDPQMIKVP